jgi:hypothetical protein
VPPHGVCPHQLRSRRSDNVFNMVVTRCRTVRFEHSCSAQKTTGASEFLLYVTPEELRQLDESMTALARQFVDRIGNPKKRPKGSIPIELLFFAYPRPAHRGYPRAAR